MTDAVARSKQAEAQSRYAKENRAKENARQKAWNLANAERRARISHSSRLKAQYGITIEQYEAMLAGQGGRCAICRTITPGRQRRRWFCVDHEHATGKVRGLLCANCNDGLGRFKEDVSTMASAIDYLNTHGAVSLRGDD